MSKTVGVVVAERIMVGLLDDHALQGTPAEYPKQADETNGLVELPADALCELICDAVAEVAPADADIFTVGVALPGIVHKGVILDSPNLPQLKGAHIRDNVEAGLKTRGIERTVQVFNDADAVAAGLAASRGRLDRSVRVWTIGNGIGFGRFPYAEGVWEGGHMVVTLDPKETYCGCGGRGHLEGIMGYRAMRLRFLDMEPEEVFAAAKKGDARCMDFVRLWHRGLGAATATSIHLGGPGRFYYTGINVRFLDLNLLKEYLWQMVKMSPLQSYALEVVPENNEIGVIGAAASALLAPAP